MSEAVVLYQLSILASVIGVGVVVGKKPMVWVAIAWSVWTLVMLFTRWLFILQFGTIAVAFFSGFAIQESARYPAIQSFIRKSLLWLGVLAVIGIAVILYVENSRQRDYVERPAGSSSQSTSPPVKSFPPAQTRTPQELYGEAIREVEQRHPQLNPTLPDYRQDSINEAVNRMDGYVKQGYAKHDALRMGVADMELPATPTPSTWTPPAPQHISPPSRQNGGIQHDVHNPEIRPCVYKGVMSDADYRACGLNPPQNRPLEPKTAPTAVEPYVYDKGDHQGYPQNCRWLSQNEWSCK